MQHEHEHDPTLPSELTRREFLRLAGASIALAGLDGCSRMPAEHILPYVDNRPESSPGVGAYYATAMMLDGLATGLIVESHDGRPTKIEGNPAHPASLGAAGPFEQASVLQLYDPDRATHARVGQARSDWSSIAASLSPATLRTRVGQRGERLSFLIEPTSSPLDEELLSRVAQTFPSARFYMYAPLLGDRANAPVVPHYDIAAASVIVAVDSDFLASGPFHLRYARQFADGRRLKQPTDAMNRLYAIEPSFTPTGAAADHRFAIRPRDIEGVLRDLLAALSQNAPAASPWVSAIARDLVANRGRSVVIVGTGQTPAARALGDAINAAIGAANTIAWYAPSPLIGRSIAVHTLTDLVASLRAHEVDTLVIVGGNPSYTTPAALGLRELLRQVPNSGYVGLYENETARDARWFVPMSHYLESWGDARAYDGTLSIVQPLVTPLYASITPAELYATIAGGPTAGGRAYDLLRASWKSRMGSGGDEAWASALQRGFVPGSAFPKATATIASIPAATPVAREGIDIVYAADSKVHDGAFANNGWLQELPAPITQLTWGNAALLSRVTAAHVGVRDGELVKLSANGRELELPALIVPGHADDTVTVHFGYGRAGAEATARGVGGNAYELWPAIGGRSESGVVVARAAGSAPLNLSQTHPTIGPNDPVRRATLAEYRAAPSSVGQRSGRMLSLYPEFAPPPNSNSSLQWAMTIDLSTCIGCGACVVACQSENNIPVVGAEEVRKGRAMQWIHVERYFVEREQELAALLQPMLCQHCEKAPCEYVCPVGATTHSADGLNEMVYNRCVGTRFCSNNCPYKVRHFNWFDYNQHLAETELMVKNPNVSVRERGVMEKCTFCVQRIREAEIAARREGRELHGTDVQTACQQACPTKAIVFGSLTEADSDVVRQREQPRSYGALAELGTEPRVRYLARIRNENREITG